MTETASPPAERMAGGPGAGAGGPRWSQVGWLTADRLGQGALALVATIIVARHLGSRGFGELSQALALIALVTPLAALAMGEVATRRACQEGQAPAVVFGGAVIARLAGGAVAGLLALGVALAMRGVDGPDAALVLPLALALLPAAAHVLDQHLIIADRGRLLFLTRLGSLAGAHGLRLGLVLAGCGVLAFAWAYLLEAILVGAGLLLAFRRAAGSGPRLAGAGPEAAGLARAAWPLVAASLVTACSMRIDQLLLGLLADDAAVGMYAAAVRLSDACFILPGVLVSAHAPGVLRAAGESPEALERAMRRLYRQVGLLSAAIALGASLGSGILVSLAYGEGFAGSTPVLAVSAWSAVFMALGAARGVHLIALGRSRLHLATTLIGLVGNLGINLLLMPRSGAVGAAIAGVAGQFLAAVGACAMIPRLWPVLGTMAGSLLPAGPGRRPR